jgi:4'-phosphopantetheinyl transferase
MNVVIWRKPPKTLLANRSELHVWQIGLDIKQPLYTLLTSLLSPREIHDANTFIFEEEFRRYQISYGFKRLVLAKYLNIPPKTLNLEKSKCGKPFISHLQNSLNIQFNLSHSHNLILMVVTIQDAVGIDVEHHIKELSEEILINTIFSANERLFFSNLIDEKERKKVFYRCWTRKEAYLKAQGVGLISDLKSISVDLNEFPSNPWITIPNNPEMKTSWKLFPLNLGELYTASIVATPNQKHIIYYTANYLR